MKEKGSEYFYFYWNFYLLYFLLDVQEYYSGYSVKNLELKMVTAVRRIHIRVANYQEMLLLLRQP